MAALPEVIHNPAASRFEMTVDGHLSVAEYHLRDGRMVFTHTFVPPELRGRGIAERLVLAGFRHAREHGYRIVPQCSYVAVLLARRPEFQDLAA